MKVKTLEKMKFVVLKAQVGLPLYQVIGLLEGLWYLTATRALQGDVGRFSNVEIAAWLEWGGDADRLIKAYVDAGFLDPCAVHRLVVHDWQTHAPPHVKGCLANQKQPIFKAVTPTISKAPPLVATLDPVLGVGILSSPLSPEPITGRRKRDKEKPATPRATRVPDFPVCPKEWLEAANTIRPDLPVQRVLIIYAEFMDYWKARAGAEALKCDWLATWRNWLRRDQNYKGSKPNRESVADHNNRVLRTLFPDGPNGGAGDVIEGTVDDRDETTARRF